MLDFKKEIRDYIAWAVVGGLAILSFGLIFYYMDTVNNDINNMAKREVSASKDLRKEFVRQYVQYHDTTSSTLAEEQRRAEEERQKMVEEKFVNDFNILAEAVVKLKEGSTGKDSIGSYKVVGGVKEYTLSVGNDIKVEWYKPIPLSEEEMLFLLKIAVPACALVNEYALNPLYDKWDQTLSVDRMAKVGNIVEPDNLAGKEIFLFRHAGFAACELGCDGGDGGYGYNSMGFFDNISKQFVFFYNPGNDDECRNYPEDGNLLIRKCAYENKECRISGESEKVNFFGGKITKQFDELQLPKKINVSNYGSALFKVGYYMFGLDNIYPESNPIKDYEILFGNVFKEITTSSAPLYFTVSPIDTTAIYDYIPYFLTEQKSRSGVLPERGVNIYIGNINFSLNTAKKLDSKFVLGYPTLGSCGRVENNNLGEEIVNEKDFFKDKELTVVGKTIRGDSIYEIVDKANNTLYQKDFENIYNLEQNYNDNSESIVTSSEQLIYSLNKSDFFNPAKNKKYKNYLDSVPFIFWKDEFGNWRVYARAYYWQQQTKMNMAECGKPVIYLYPQKDTNVNVQVAPNGGLTVVDPFYPSSGWDVLATPESVLTNTDGKTYPYLFWEGKAYGMNIPNQGFVLKREQMGKQMTALLAKLGLNAKETKDFLEFWQSKLEEKDFAFVTFLPQSEFDSLAPLTVSPQPDKVIRVFMIYEPLDSFVKVAPLKIETPVRSGFTVVEWGGRLLEKF